MNFLKHVKLRKEKFGSVIFQTLKEKVYITNETGSDILKLVSEGQDKENILKNLSRAYEGDLASMGNQVSTFINQLKEKELLAE